MSNYATNSPEPDAPVPAAGALKRSERLRAYLSRYGRPLLEGLVPRPRLLKNETIEKTVRMAQYRLTAPKIVGLLGGIVIVLATIVTVIASTYDNTIVKFLATLFILIGVAILFSALEMRLAYEQWQFILTDKRIILVTPDPDRRGFADAIYLQRNSIKVLDTNYSKNALWGLFQMMQGTRDVMLSTGGYEFQETGARVKGGLRFPDVTMDDVRDLEELIFGQQVNAAGQPAPIP